MIVITSINHRRVFMAAGDSFCLVVDDGFGMEVLIRETVRVPMNLDFCAAYIFVLEDGSCPCFHVSGIFGLWDNMPDEFKNAKRLEDLSEAQYARLKQSAGIIIPNPKTKELFNGRPDQRSATTRRSDEERQKNI
jgi:hypothetical protein